MLSIVTINCEDESCITMSTDAHSALKFVLNNNICIRTSE